MVFPWKLVGDALSRKQAAGSHRSDEGLESRRVCIQRPKVILAVRFGRRITGLQRLRQRFPQLVFATIVLIEAGTQIGRFRLVEITIALLGVAVLPFAISRKQTHRDERVEEVAGGATVGLNV